MKTGYMSVAMCPEDIAVYAWASRWEPEKIRQCFNEMPTEVAVGIARARSAEEVRKIMMGSPEEPI